MLIATVEGSTFLADAEMQHFFALTAAATGCVAGQIILNASTLARRYDGFGGLSGGGATSRLLPDYKDPYRSDVLDMLFKPFWGVSAHILKVEVGGDTFSGCGTEPSHRRADDDLSFQRGYEWWLMREAASRNPSVLGYSLPWGFSNWVGADTGGNPLNSRQAQYMTEFCLGALSNVSVPPSVLPNLSNSSAASVVHTSASAQAPGTVGGGWNCDYIGIWNEQAWSVDYTVQLRTSLDAAGLNSTRIIIHDLGGDQADVVAALHNNNTFAQAMYAIGVHYPGGSNSTNGMQSAGVPLWSSEDSSTYFDAAGGGCLARVQNWNWLYGQYSSITIWNLVTSYLDHLFWWGDSLLSAAYPWSGSWNDVAPTWAAAHWTQFAWPGWYFLPPSLGQQAGYGGAGLLPGGGTYVMLVDPSSTSSDLDAWAQQEYDRVHAGESNMEHTMGRKEQMLAQLRREAHERHFASGRAFEHVSPGKPAVNVSAPKGSAFHWSLMIETTTPQHSMCIRSNPSPKWSIAPTQNVTFKLADSLVIPSTVVVWKTVFAVSAGEPAVSWFQRLPDLAVDASTGMFTLTDIHPDCQYTLTSMDRGQRHGTPSVPPPANTPFPSYPSSYTESFQGYQNDSMPAYFSDQAGSWAVRPRRDGNTALGTVYEQAVTALSIGWHNGDDSSFPLTIIGDWNQSSQDVTVEAWIQDRAGPGTSPGDPLPSLLPCDATHDSSQRWSWNSSDTMGLPGSVKDAQLGQCMDVFGCNGNAGTPVWMWPCVNSTNGGWCAQSNQQWSWQSWAGGQLVTLMPDGLCLTVLPTSNASSNMQRILSTGAYSLQMQPCQAGPASSAGHSQPSIYQSWFWDASTGAIQLCHGTRLSASGCTSPTGACLSSQPPAVQNNGTFVSIGLRLGGALPTSSVVKAYSDDWYTYGYWLTVTDTGYWAVSKGGSQPGQVSMQEVQQRVDARSGAPGQTVRKQRSSFTSVDNRVLLASGTLRTGPGGMGLRSWHKLRFAVTDSSSTVDSSSGPSLSAWFDGQPLFSDLVDATSPVYPVGWAGLSSGWHVSQFANFSFTGR